LAKDERIKLAKVLLQTSKLKMAEVAVHAGFINRNELNKALKASFKRSGRDLRRQSQARVDAESIAQITSITLILPVAQPYDFDWVFNYLEGRALTGIETIFKTPEGQVYQRRISQADQSDAWVLVRRKDSTLHVQLPLAAEPVHLLLGRVRRLFDLDADGAGLHKHLIADKLLRPLVKQAPGLRVPGAWDGFETCVRAVLGQQVSVARGTELGNALVSRYGRGNFPSPSQLIDQQIAELGMPGNRGRAISALAQRVIDADETFDQGDATAAFVDGLLNIKGIGPWTVNYINLRVLKNSDAFPHNDWVVLKQLETTPALAKLKAQPWRPWRAYGLMYLWYAASVQRAAAGKNKTPVPDKE
jgi:AraC family transcriptional regulator of adaptative response / DNA-3-methyladenine glycosylase II